MGFHHVPTSSKKVKDTQSDLNSTEEFIKMEATEVKEIGNLLT